MRAHEPRPTLLRHALGVRVAHGALAAAVIVLIVTGLGMAGHLPGPVTMLLGGHIRLGILHRVLGAAGGAAIAGLLLLGPAAGRRLIRDMCRFRRGDVAWLTGFARYVLAPHRFRPRAHGGRFDPGQRIVFAVMLGSFAALTGSAAALYLAPAGSTWLLAWALRAHIVAAVVFIAAILVHVAVGVGLLASHRAIGRVMFGDGRVRESLARTLWPAWAAQQNADPATDAVTGRRPGARDTGARDTGARDTGAADADLARDQSRTRAG